MILMYENLQGLGGFKLDNKYWSSSEDAAGLAWSQNFNTGLQANAGKNLTYYVRPVRAF